MNNVLKKLSVLLVLINCNFLVINAQSISRKVISVAGGTLTGGSNQITFTIGETIGSTLSAGSNLITQGFQQPGEELYMGTISTAMCVGSSATIPYTAIDIGGGNTFSAQLSDASGSFTNPINIGTQTGNSSGVINAVIPTNIPAGTGYRVRVISSFPEVISNDNGTDIVIQVPSTPAASVISDAVNNEICTGNSVNLTLQGGSLSSSASWQWYRTSCGGIPSGSGTTITVSPSSTATYYVRAEESCGNSLCAQITIVVKSAPPAASISSVNVPAYACSGSNITATCNSITTASAYTWDGPAGTFFDGGSANPFTTTSPNVIVNYGVPNGSGYNICVQASNACGVTNRKCTWVRGTVNVPGIITPANNRTVECAGTSANYNIAPVGGATGYTWSITGNASISGTGTSITVNFGSAWSGGNLCVTANTPCYSSASRCISLSSVTTAPGTITGPATVCPGSGSTYSIPTVPGAAVYNWIIPPNATGSSGSNSILVNFGTGFIQGDIKVSITSICGVTSVQKIKTISTGLPVIPASISGSIAGLCNQTVVYSCPAVNGASGYTWSTPGTINSGQGSTSVNVTFGSFSNGSVCVKANNSCGSGAQRCIPVKGSPTIAGLITVNPGTICANQAGVDFQVTPVFGTSGYNWNFPSGVNVVLDLGNEQIVNWGTTGGTVSVTAANTCGNTTKTTTIALNCRETKPVAVEEVGLFNVYPNPAHDKISIQFYAPEKNNYSLSLTDLSGRIITNVADVVAQKGINVIEADLTRFAKGVYLMEFRSENLNKNIKVILE